MILTPRPHRAHATPLILSAMLGLGCGACQTGAAGAADHADLPSGGAQVPFTGNLIPDDQQGASPRPVPLTADRAAEAATHLDVIAEGLDEYGSVSASAAVVLRRPREFFGFRLDLTPRDIFNMSGRIGAASAVGEFESVQVRLAVALKLLAAANAATDPIEAANLQGQAEATLAGALVDEAAKDVDAAGAGDDAAAGGEVAAPKLPTAGGATAPSNFSGQDSLQTGALGLRAPEALDIPLRQLIQQTFDDHTVLKLFEWFSAPDPATLGPNKEVFAAVLNVNCRPGRRTYSGYIGEVAVQVGYAKVNQQGGVTEQPGRHPLAFGVFPAMDTQLIDERTSIRKQFAINLLFEAMLPNAGGSAGLDAVRRLNRDLATLTARNAVVGFNVGGSTFGWRFSPRLVAQTDPGAEETGAGSSLEPQTIPAVVLIIADREDIAGRTGSATFDHFVFRSTMRWSPAGSPEADESWVPFSREFHDLRHPRLRETEFMDWALRADQVEAILSGAAVQGEAQPASTGQAPPGTSGWAAATLRKRLDLLRASGLGADHYVAIPEQRDPPSFATAGVVDLWCDRTSDILIAGDRLMGAVTAVSVAGRPARFETLGEQSLRILVDPAGGTPSQDLHPVLVSHSGGVAHVANARFSLRSSPVDQARPPSGRLEAAPVTVTGDSLSFVFASPQDVPAFADKLVLTVRPHGTSGVAREAKSLVASRAAPNSLRIDLPTLTPPLTAAQYEIDLLSVAGDGQASRSVLARPGIAVLANTADELQLSVQPSPIAFNKDGAAQSGLTIGTPGLWRLWAMIDPSIAGLGEDGSAVSLLLSGGGRNIVLPLTRLPGGDVVIKPNAISIDSVFLGLPADGPLSVDLTAQSLVGKAGKPLATPPIAGTVKFIRELKKDP